MATGLPKRAYSKLETDEEFIARLKRERGRDYSALLHGYSGAYIDNYVAPDQRRIVWVES